MKTLRFLVFAHLAVVACTLIATAQDAVEAVPLFERDPYDQITVDEENGGGTFKVMPLVLPERKLPLDPKPGDFLKVRLLDGRETPAQIAWRNIVKVELFEQLVLAEAQRLAAAQDFEAAYDHFAFLHENYPKLSGLAEATREFRYRNAGVLFQQQRLAEALALLEEVYREAPQRSGLTAALANVSQPLFDAYMQDEQFDAARQLVARTAHRGDDAAVKLSRTWQERLETAARAQEKLAREHFAANEFRQAHEAAQRMAAIWPDLPGGRELVWQIAQRYPIVRVGVGQLRPTISASYSFERAAVRTAALTQRPLAVLSQFGPDGPVYESPWGRVAVADNRRSLTVELPPAGDGGEAATGYDVAHAVLEKCEPTSASHDPHWASLLKSARVDDVYQVNLELHRPHSQPLAVLTSDLPDSMASAKSRSGVYIAAESATGQAEYVAVEASATKANTGPHEVIEIAVNSSAAALADLRRGRLDIVERLAPRDVAAVENDPAIRVGRYAVPSVHLLVPNSQRVYPANSTFRRAIAYGIARDGILRDDVLDGVALAGCRTISGPFPAGSAKDTWAYAYDNAIEPLAYEPRMALTLLRVADDEVTRAAQASGDKAPARGAVVIGHGGDWLHRMACESIVEQLQRIGIPSQRQQLSSDDADAADQCDFWYLELVVNEPLVDGPQMFGPGGLVAASPYLTLAARDVMHAVSAQQAGERLHALHATVHAEQAVIPLWQLVDHYAHRGNISGIEGQPVTLYRRVQHWRTSTDNAEQAARR